MQIVRMIVWVLLLAVLLVFSINNWNPIELKIWEGLVLETKVPALVVVALLLGFVPMWLIHRTTKWQMQRRIGSLEAAARAAAISQAETAALGEQQTFTPAPEPRLVQPPLSDTPESR